MIHIVFEEANVETLQKAIALDETLAGEIVHIKDDYAIGPLGNIYVREGMEARRQWWKMVLSGGDYDGIADDGHVNDNGDIASLVGEMRRNEETIIWIWMAQNAHDVCGYYWLLYYMAEFSGRVFILYMNNLPFINEKGNLFYPNSLYEIQPKEFLKAKKLARPITASELEVDMDEWKKLCTDEKQIRILEGGKKIASHPIEYYDHTLKKYITGDFSKASRIIYQLLSKEKEKTGDAFLLWRLKQILETGEWETKGEIKTMKDFEIRNPKLPSLKKNMVEAEK